MRWLARFADGGGSVVATFAPLPDWLPPYGTAEMSESPGAVGVVTHQSTEGVGRVSGVQSLHVDADGRPRLDRPEDRGGLAKRSHGSMTGAVCLIGELAGSGPLHVVEGIADALAVAAREGGAGGFARLAPDLAALSRPVLIHADGDPAGIVAARRLAAALTRRGIAGAVRTHPPGCDPAQPTR
ncbi:MAG: toprim domain-containing protein [Gemmatimonadota bacterium]|nr:toprim domain-containing protein [Gemmatimonadota bacterium]